MENQIEQLDSITEQTDGQQPETVEETKEIDPAELKARLDKIEETNRQLYERAKKAEAKLLKEKVEKKVESVLEQKAGELDETQLEYLDLKGIRDDDEIEIIKGVIKKTGMSLRSAINDDYVQTKLAHLKRDKEKLDATPGSTRRTGGNEINTTDYWVARYEQKGELPKDFELQSQVFNKLIDRHNTNKPAWRQ